MTKEEKKQVAEWRSRFATELRRLHQESKNKAFTDSDINAEIAGLSDKEVLSWVKGNISPEQSAREALM